MATRTAHRAYGVTLTATGNVLKLRGRNPRSGTTAAEGMRIYLWDPDRQCDDDELQDYALLSSFEATRDDDGSIAFFIFYVEDSMQPSLHAIQADGFEAAYDAFVEAEGLRGHYVLDENDPEFDPEGDHQAYTPSGIVDTELFQGFEVDFHALEDKPVHVVENPSRGPARRRGARRRN